MFFYFFIVLLVIYLYQYYKHHYFYWRSQNVKGPFPIPIFNDYYNQFIYPLHDYNLKCLKDYGEVWISFANSTYNDLYIVDPELIKQVLVKDFKQYNGRIGGEMFGKYFDKILFLRDETSGWKHIRNAISPMFTTGKLKGLYSNLDKPIYHLITSMDEQLGENNFINDFNPLINFKKFTWNITLNLFFSIEFDSVKVENAFVEKFLTAKNDSVFVNLLGLFMPMWIANKLNILPLPSDTYEYLVKLSLTCIEQRKQSKQTNYNDLLQSFLETGLSEEDMIGQFFALFLGGFESIASTCSFALYELALHPEIQDKLYKELKETFPNDHIDYDKITSSPYLEAFIKEVLRKHPVITKLLRYALDDYELEGIKIRKDTFVSVPIYALHHHEKYWPNPTKFDPDRFLDNEPLPFTYLPFGNGPRMCVASRLGELELRVFLINFVKRYESYKTSFTKSPLEYKKFDFVVTPKEDIILGVRKRDV